MRRGVEAVELVFVTDAMANLIFMKGSMSWRLFQTNSNCEFEILNSKKTRME